MRIQYGAEVLDCNGEVLGTVDHLVHDLKDGELRKFVVRRPMSRRNLFVTPADVLDASPTTVKLKLSHQELKE